MEISIVEQADLGVPNSLCLARGDQMTLTHAEPFIWGTGHLLTTLTNPCHLCLVSPEVIYEFRMGHWPLPNLL